VEDKSQYGEATFIYEHFAGRVGRFLDIGAFDGTTLSNTKPLADAGWSGVCVEPSPPAFCWLMKAYEGNPRIDLANVCVSPQNGKRIQRFDCNTSDGYSADAVSTLIPAHAAKFKDQPFREIFIPTVSVQDLRWAFGEKFDFINIDVEGLNTEVLWGVGGEMKAEMVCVELDPIGDMPTMKAVLGEMGLTEHKLIGGNLLAWRKA